jgi:hypothetical protein
MSVNRRLICLVSTEGKAPEQLKAQACQALAAYQAAQPSSQPLAKTPPTA